jgi:hypothetical protein
LNNPSNLQEQSRAHVMAAGHLLLQRELGGRWQQPDIQEAFADAKQRYGHVLCLCRPEPLKLQIRQRDGLFHLAVWPQEGPKHDTECIYFRDELVDAHRGIATPSQIQATSACPEDRIAYLIGVPAHPGIEGLALSVRTFAARLWEAASLCRWHPSWSRDWGRTRYQLLQAAKGMTVNGLPCEKLLFVPRPYRAAVQANLNTEWEQFVRTLAVGRGTTHLLIAPIRRLVDASADRPGVVYLRHLRVPVGLSQACHDFIQRECRNILRSLRLQPDSNAQARELAPEVVGIFQVESSSRGGVWARAGWLTAVHPRVFIPAANPQAVALIDRLIADGHAFQHLPSETPSSRRQSPDWLLRHVLGPDGRPVARAALEILDRGAGASYMEARAALAQRMQAQGIPTWTWVPTGPRNARTVPPLPPSDQRPGTAVHEELQQIQSAPDADFCYGPSFKFSLTERKSA